MGTLYANVGTLLLLLVGAAGVARAGGQYLGDGGSAATARAGAFVAKADDPSALFLNPAGLALVDDAQLSLGTNLVHMSLSYQRAGVYEALGEGYTGQSFPAVENDGPIQPIPFIGAVFPRGRLSIGAGLHAPQGYPLRNLPNRVTLADGTDAPAPQRYDAVAQKSRAAFASLAAAYAVSDRLRVGVRGSWGFAQLESAKYVQGLSNPGEEVGKDSLTMIEAADWFVPTFGVGVHYVAGPRLELGASFTGPVPIRAVGTSSTQLGDDLKEPVPGVDNDVVPVDDNQARCAPGGQPGAFAACVDIDLPMTATAGARFVARDPSGRELGDIELDLRWENWSRASDYRVVVDAKNTALDMPLEPSVIRHGLIDTISARLGASARLGEGERPAVLRLGVSYDSAAAPATWSRLDIDTAPRFSAAAGFGVFFGRHRLDLGVAVFGSPTREVRDIELADTRDMDDRVQPDIQVPSSSADAQPYHPHNAGDYQSSYVVGSVGLTSRF